VSYYSKGTKNTYGKGDCHKLLLSMQITVSIVLCENTKCLTVHKL